MAENLGKKFEKVIEQCFSKIPEVSVDRLHDQTTGFAGSTNICDFIVYKKPNIYYIECKSVHGNTLSISSVPKPDKYGVLHCFHGNITDHQWDGMLEKSKIPGVIAGVICWWVDKDITVFFPINLLETWYNMGHKSVRYDSRSTTQQEIIIPGTKKRVFFDYDMSVLFPC